MRHSENMGFQVLKDKVVNKETHVKTIKAPVRNKKISYSASELPKLEIGKPYGVNKVIELSMKAFAQDERIFSVDSDLASTSGLQAGISFIDKYRAYCFTWQYPDHTDR